MAEARKLLCGPPFLRVHADRQRVELPARVGIRALERRLLLRIQIEGCGGRGAGGPEPEFHGAWATVPCQASSGD